LLWYERADWLIYIEVSHLTKENVRNEENGAISITYYDGVIV
jgi:hypothetical protein